MIYDSSFFVYGSHFWNMKGIKGKMAIFNYLLQSFLSLQVLTMRYFALHIYVQFPWMVNFYSFSISSLKTWNVYYDLKYPGVLHPYYYTELAFFVILRRDLYYFDLFLLSRKDFQIHKKYHHQRISDISFSVYWFLYFFDFSPLVFPSKLT